MRLTCLGLALIALGCAPARGGTSGFTTGSDAGTDVPSGTDAPSGTDSAATDTAVPALDTGTAPVDASMPPDDQGVTPVDAGPPPPVDAGPPPPVDAGPPPPVDAGCMPSGPENTNLACGDGVDNDCDGFVDCIDFDCSRNPAVTLCPRDAGPPDTGCIPRPENTNLACGDGVDNDCDGFVDCNDFDCSRSPSVTLCPRDSGVPLDLGCIPTGAENTNFTCGDGVDNDCDGFVDCIDFDCTRTGTLATVCRDAGVPVDTGAFRDAGPRADAVGCVRTGDENNLTACTDGVDNDCDGFVDCADRNCSCVGSCPAALLNCTCRGLENTNASCVDRVDNDCNGFVDCSDFGCSRNPLVTVCGIN